MSVQNGQSFYDLSISLAFMGLIIPVYYYCLFCKTILSRFYLKGLVNYLHCTVSLEESEDCATSLTLAYSTNFCVCVCVCECEFVIN